MVEQICLPPPGLEIKSDSAISLVLEAWCCVPPIFQETQHFCLGDTHTHARTRTQGLLEQNTCAKSQKRRVKIKGSDEIISQGSHQRTRRLSHEVAFGCAPVTTHENSTGWIYPRFFLWRLVSCAYFSPSTMFLTWSLQLSWPTCVSPLSQGTGEITRENNRDAHNRNAQLKVTEQTKLPAPFVPKPVSFTLFREKTHTTQTKSTCHTNKRKRRVTTHLTSAAVVWNDTES